MPIVQGGTISFLVPTLAILNLPQWKCPASEVLNKMPEDERTELWQIRMRELSGAIAVSALFQVIVGYGGIIYFRNEYKIQKYLYTLRRCMRTVKMLIINVQHRSMVEYVDSFEFFIRWEGREDVNFA